MTMRNLFLALVLANLGFAAWHSWFAAPAGRSPVSKRGDAPGITLVSELGKDTDQAVSVASSNETAAGGATASSNSASAPAPTTKDNQDSSSAPAPATSANDRLRCVTVGPFKELSQAAAAAAQLRSSGLDPMQRVAEGDIWVGYWVYLKEIATQAQAKDILAKLRAHKITDAYVIPDTDSGNLVSLGVFSEIARARSRLEAVRALGYDVTVADRTRRGTVYWIDVRLANGQSVDFDKLQPAGRIIRLEQRPCQSAHP